MESTVADNPDGFGGGFCKVVAVTVTPLDTSGVGLPLIAQTLNEYCVSVLSPVTAWDVPEMELSLIVVPAAHVAGADTPV